MKLKSVLLVALLSCIIHFNTFAQIIFEKGYFVDNKGVRVECLIKNVDWENNPKSFQYKVGNGGTVLKGELADVSEFGIDNVSAYVRVNAQIDYSLTDLNFLNSDRNPNWKQELLFLKLLVKGDASLLLFKQNNLSQFYYQKADSSVIPLVYKMYKTENGQTITNFGYRQQLFNELKCASLDLDYTSHLKYSDNDLIRFFEKYNGCKNENYQVFEKKKGQNPFHLKITPGLDLTQLKTGSFTRSDMSGGMSDKLSFRLGCEAEYIAPFNKGKWGLIIEPAFQYYKFGLKSPGLRYNVNYWSVEVPVGIRHYVFLKDDWKLFVNGLYVVSAYNKQLKKEAAIRKMDINSGSNLAFGVGIAKKRLSAELRYLLSRDVRTSYVSTTASFTRISLILGYKIFR